MNESTFGYQAELPETDRQIFCRLCNDLAWLNAKWQLYQDLFSEKENTELLNRRAPGAFQIIEEALRNDLTMAMSRLSDPTKHGKNENLSLAQVAENFDHVPGLKALRDEFNQACKPVQTLRNKQVGHKDLNTSLYPQDNPVPGVGRKDIDRIISLAVRILNSLVRSVCDTTYGFDLHVIGGGPALIRALRVADKAHQAERERIEALCRNQ